MAKNSDAKNKKNSKKSEKSNTSVPADVAAPSTLTRFMQGIKEVVSAAGQPAADAAPAKKTKKAAAASPAPTPAPTAPVPNGAALVPIEDEEEEVVLTDAEGRRYCRATDCDQIGVVDGYCRFHYLLYWKKIQNRKRILADGKLERYIEELTARYTDKFVELLRKDTKNEKDFLAAIQELELDEAANSNSGADEDEAKTYIEEISGVGTSEARDDEGF